MHIAYLALLALLGLPLAAHSAESTCYGSVSNGRLEGGVKLPDSGPNYTRYSTMAAWAGRTYVHSRVALVVEDAYTNLSKALPDTTFVYGETGLRNGGRFRPHRTHQNGLSVDFFVPVRDASGKSVPIPTSPLTRFGYDLEFGADGRLDDLHIDFNALAEHLHQLSLSAKEHGAPIALVILDPVYVQRVLDTPRGASIRGLPFMKGKPWVRHDKHFHVDFKVTCRAIEALD